MKKAMLYLIILFAVKTVFSQKIILHRNTGSDQTYYISSVDSITFLPFACGDEIRYEGRTYHTVSIGTQCWMKENLDVGTMINGNLDQTNNTSIEKYCYNNDTANCTIYGGLYQWNESMQYSTIQKAQGICPVGWHIPNLVDFDILTNSVSGDGNALKEIDQGTGTNTSGFSALLSGYRFLGGTFGSLNEMIFLYSSTEGGASQAYYMYLPDSGSDIGYYNNNILYGMTVRCLKN